MNLWGHRFYQNANQKFLRFLPCKFSKLRPLWNTQSSNWNPLKYTGYWSFAKTLLLLVKQQTSWPSFAVYKYVQKVKVILTLVWWEMHIFSPCHQPRGVIEEHCLCHTMRLNLFSQSSQSKASFPHEPIFTDQFFTDKLFAQSWYWKGFLQSWADSICFFRFAFFWKTFLMKLSLKKFLFIMNWFNVLFQVSF